MGFPMRDNHGRETLISLAVLGIWGALVSIQLGWLPWARHAWGYNLWQYFPTWTRVLLATATLALCSERVRETLWALATNLCRRSACLRAPGTTWPAGLLLWVVLSFLLWTVREQRFLGDSRILVWHASNTQFLFPDVGATFLIGSVVRAARGLALLHEGVVAALQGVVSASGALMILCTWRAGRYLGNGHGLGIALLILSGGFLRILAGHLEVYAFVLAAAAAFLWSSLAFQSGRGHWATPCLALGFAVWLHPSALALVPSLVFLLHSAEGSRPLKRVVLGLVVASLPWLLFAPVLLSASHHDALEQSREVFLQVLGLSDDPKTVHRWVRGWGGGPGVGTDYVFLSLPHLKYLVNAFHLLCAWAAPALLLLVSRPTRFLSTPTARFLTAASLPLVAYALVLRPVWGPFDWDLFSLTALFVASLSAHLLASALPETTFQHTIVWLVGFNLLFVGLPLVAAGFAPIHAAGPFATETFDPGMTDPNSAALAEIAPWL